MSKMDGLRAMREAKYAAAQKAGGAATSRTARRPAPVAPDASTASPKATRRPQAAPATTEASTETEALCGHRNMSGRTCTREQGHAAKSHRYS